MTAINLAFSALKLSETYPSVTFMQHQTSRFLDMSAPERGFNSEILQWCETNEIKLYEDFFCRIKPEATIFYFRTEDMACRFKLQFS